MKPDQGEVAIECAGVEGATPSEKLRTIGRRLVELSMERHEAERAVTTADDARRKAFAARDESESAAAEAEYRTLTAELDARIEKERASIGAAASRATRDAKASHQKRSQELQSRFRQGKELVDRELFDRQWEATTVSEASIKESAAIREDALRRHSELSEQLTNRSIDLDRVFRAARVLMSKAEWSRVAPAKLVDLDAVGAFEASIADLENEVDAYQRMLLPRLFGGAKVAWLFVLPLIGLAAIGAIFVDRIGGSIGGAILGLALGAGLFALVRALAAKRLAERVPALREAKSRVESLVEPARLRIDELHSEAVKASAARRERSLEEAKSRHAKKLAGLETAREQGTNESEAEARGRLDAAKARHEAERTRIESEYLSKKAELERAIAVRRGELAARRGRAIAEFDERRDREWQVLIDRWRAGRADLDALAESLEGIDRAAFLDFGSGRTDWRPPAAVPPALRFGSVEFSLSGLPHGVSKSPRLAEWKDWDRTLPALVDFPGRGSLVIEGPEDARERVVSLQQAFMLRYLTSLPPARVRMTILDPVGLGRSFGAFMHLADHQEALVNTRIWTEPEDIAERLAELNQQIETVLQRCLRNEYASIEDYNAHAGELAEPYRLMVVGDFPAGFNEQAARRLAAIAGAGARCGVYVILGIDSTKAGSASFRWQDLKTIGERIIWEGGRFVWVDRELERYPLRVDNPPPAEVLTPLLHDIGRAAAAAARVELPFEVIVPPRESWWTSSTARGVDVPLGRSGANRLQHLQLGHGTAQHVLIAGRTGSGKSSLLHAFITNTALVYGPDEIELYLIDFKKGVEFKTYATHRLPHARVIAIESDREFGLSVLDKLDRELKARGELFRDMGVQDLPAYRARNGSQPMPRILLIVDEFQEFFVEDDKIAQEASLLLDRLVRQGRAFGIHIHLGSQTLGGAYSLARSTLGQMAIRIALQCTESDAHLILSDDNSAARDLARPGEAIYNDANGLSEGNAHFQIVWLGEAKREAYLTEIAAMSRSRGFELAEPIVFEGHAPAELSKCVPLERALSGELIWRAGGSVQGFLGEAVAIKDPTAATFAPLGASNLLMIGPNETSALGSLTSLLIGLAAQTPAGTVEAPGVGSRIVVSHATTVEESAGGWFQKVGEAIGERIELGGQRELAARLGEFIAEYERRQSLAGPGQPPWFFVVWDLQRFRELRKSEEDFSFSRRGEEKPANPSKLLTTLLREGPPLGLHVVIWCDGLNTLSRFFERATQKEFAQRVLYQMSSADSSNLIDSPAASRLGPYRGLYFHEERANLEKFRPYGLPEVDWMRRVGMSLSRPPRGTVG